LTSLKILSNRKTVWVLFWAYSLLVLKGAIMSAYDFPGFLGRLNDKLVHGAEYLLLIFISWAAFRAARTPPLQNRPLAFAFGYCLIMGVLTECLQAGSETRSPSVADFLADAAGTAMGFILILIFKNRKKA
jgi:VanZ family protein